MRIFPVQEGPLLSETRSLATKGLKIVCLESFFYFGAWRRSSLCCCACSFRMRSHRGIFHVNSAYGKLLLLPLEGVRAHSHGVYTLRTGGVLNGGGQTCGFMSVTIIAACYGQITH
ncbi:hypothetical protein GDO78_015384 [Eleutherodactylus coqui]|uniref:Uncharacterized protein n=1 Tax=Eleutherodactylus coqui TaxID=57060 RepID=A0A8J6BEZ0_ELECQ|nr:hypothetical protein GDO78_015384 [Eleutherodactylus coqui]